MWRCSEHSFPKRTSQGSCHALSQSRYTAKQKFPIPAPANRAKTTANTNFFFSQPVELHPWIGRALPRHQWRLRPVVWRPPHEPHGQQAAWTYCPHPASVACLPHCPIATATTSATAGGEHIRLCCQPWLSAPGPCTRSEEDTAHSTIGGPPR